MTTPSDCLPLERDEVVCEVHTQPDSLGRRRFTLYWLATYNPSVPVSTRPDGLFLRGQVYFSYVEGYKVRHIAHGHAFRIVDRIQEVEA